jgi:glycogen debranching enzyme
VPPDDPEFDRRRYWRGPVWVNVNWLVAEGLELAGLAAAAADLRRETLDLVRFGGFPEYFDPEDGSPCGSQGFSWSAALTLDLLERKGH